MKLSTLLFVVFASIGVSGLHLQGQSRNQNFLESTEKGGFGCPDIQWVKTTKPTPYTVRWCFSGSGCTVADDYIWVTVVSSNAYIQCRPEPIKIFETIFMWVTAAITAFIQPELTFASFWTEMFKEGVKNGIEMGMNVGQDCYCFPERWTQVDQIYTTITTDAGNTATVEVPKEYLPMVNAERVKENVLIKIRTESCNNQNWKDRFCRYNYLRTTRRLSWSDLMDEIAWLGDRNTKPQSFELWAGGDISNALCGVQPGRKKGLTVRQWCFSTSCITSDDHVDVNYDGYAEIKCENPFSLTIPAVGKMIMNAYGLNTDWRQTGGCLCYPTNYDNTPVIVYTHDESGDKSHFHIPPSQFARLDQDQIEFGAVLAVEDCSPGNWQNNICNRFTGASVKYEYDWDELGDDIAWWGDRNVDVDGLNKLTTTNLIYNPTTPIASVCTYDKPCLTETSGLSSSKFKIEDAFEIVSVYSGTCIDMADNKYSGTSAQAWPCDNSLDQRIRLIPSLDDKSYRLQFAHSLLCLENTMKQAPCTLDDSDKKQLWTLGQVGASKEFWMIFSALNPSQVVSLPKLAYANGDKLTVGPAKVMSRNIKNGIQFTHVWYLRKNIAPNPNSDTLCKNNKGENICIANTGAFKLNPAEMYDIVSMIGGGCVGQFASNNQDGNPFTQDTCLDWTVRPNPQLSGFFSFKATATANVFTIQVLHNNKCLEISSTGVLVQRSCSLSSSQQFKLTNYGQPASLWTFSLAGSTSVISVNSEKSFENIYSSAYQPPRILGTRNQFWYIRRRGAVSWDASQCLSDAGVNLCTTYPATSELYYIISASTNKCLQFSTTTVGERLGSASCSFGSTKQLFKVQPAYSTYLRFQNVFSGLCLNPENYLGNNFAQVTCLTRTDSNLQAYELKSYSYWGVSNLLLTLWNPESRKELTALSTGFTGEPEITPAGVPPTSHLFYFRKDQPAQCVSQQCAKDLDATQTQWIKFVMLNVGSRTCLEAIPQVGEFYPAIGGAQSVSCDGGATQQWEFHYQTNDSFELTSTITGLCLTRNPDKKTLTTSTCFHFQSPSKRNNWIFENPLGTYYWKILNEDTNTYLDFTSSGMVLNPASESPSQLFLLIKV